MSALVAFVEAHPWWTLVYLLVLSHWEPVRLVRRAVSRKDGGQ